ncbi:MAG TPA: CHAP domain-containing protein, partial [bacterium]|nr:CHAP domain-containing protein [bacterium]
GGGLLLAGCGGHRPPAEAAPLPPQPLAISGAESGALAGSTLGDLRSTPEVSSHARRRGAEVVAHAEAFANAGALPAGARRDCSGFILAAYRAAGAPLAIPDDDARSEKNTSAMLLRWSEESHSAFQEGTPLPGDIVFFRDTIAKKGLKNHVTHVALVERVESDGTVVLLHYMNGRIRRDPMNLSRPSDPSRNGWLRRKRRSGEPALAGELFVAYARFE